MTTSTSSHTTHVCQKVEELDAAKKGRMEAFAVQYASIRHILPMPGVIVNVRGRHIRITSTKNKKTYVIRRGSLLPPQPIITTA
jgi:hypothetical protein